MTNSAQAEETLSGLAADIRKAVDYSAKIPTSFDGAVSGDFRSRCGNAGDEWPAQWSSGRSLFLKAEDTRPAAEEIIRALEAQGWNIHRGGPGNSAGDSEVVAFKGGNDITISSGLALPDRPWSSLAINGDTACVEADGTYDQSPPS